VNLSPKREFEPVSVWLGYNLGILWALIIVVVYCWALLDGPYDVWLGLYLLLALLSAFYFGGIAALLLSVGGLLYLAVLVRFRTRWTRVRRRLLALVLSPLLGVPWWFLAWTDYGYDPGLWVLLGVVCIAYGLLVRFPRERDGRRSTLRPEATASA
jgi:hypothetical protein